jgi:hypothetical protein
MAELLDKNAMRLRGLSWTVDATTKGKKNLLAPRNAPQAATGEAGQLVQANVADGMLYTGGRSGGGLLTERAGSRYDFQQIANALDDYDLSAAELDRLVESSTATLREIASDLRKELDIPGLADTKGMQAAAATEVKDQLQADLTEYWFLSEVDNRFSEAADALLPYGLVPTEEMLRKVMNRVAGSKAPLIRSEREATSDLLVQLDVATVRAGEAGTADEAKAVVQELMDSLAANSPAADAALARIGGPAHTRSLYADFVRLGGKSFQTGDVRLAKAARRGARAEGADTRSLTWKVKGLKKERDDFLREKLYPWYRAMTGSEKTPSLSEIDAMFKAMMSDKGARRIRSWMDDDATQADVMKWLDTVTKKLNYGQMRSRRQSGWLEQAADPYVDAKRVLASPTTRQNLPSLYATKIESYASELEAQVGRLRAQQGKIAAADEVVDLRRPFEDRAALARASIGVEPGGRAPKGGSLKALFGDRANDVRTGRQLQQEFELLTVKNSVEYTAALERQQLNEVMMALSVYDTPTTATSLFVVQKPHHLAAERLRAGEVVYERVDGKFRKLEPDEVPQPGGLYFETRMDRMGKPYDIDK